MFLDSVYLQKTKKIAHSSLRQLYLEFFQDLFQAFTHAGLRHSDYFGEFLLFLITEKQPNDDYSVDRLQL